MSHDHRTALGDTDVPGALSAPDRGLLPEREHTPPRTDGPWTIGPEPARPRYMVLGEEGDETLMIHGHDIVETTIRDTARHAGFGRVLDFYDELANDEFVEVDALTPSETWARERRRCRRHWWLPRPVRRALAWVGSRLRSVRFSFVYRFALPQPKIRDRYLIANCTRCEYVDHYRSCSGCGFCASDGSGTAPPWWDWAIPDGAPADANAGRPGYLPVTIIHIGG